MYYRNPSLWKRCTCIMKKEFVFQLCFLAIYDEYDKYQRQKFNNNKILRVKIYQYLCEDFELSCVLVDSLCLDFVVGVLAGSRGIRPILSPLSSLDLSPPSEVPSNGQVPRGVSTLAWGQRSTCWYTTLYCLVVDSSFR